ncbi:Protein of unknown function DUF115 [Lachnospiraceae bacterium XBB2008]|nr:Protein of unknown function DUF115 [Lachnospiraceae bacterium XBB2008]
MVASFMNDESGLIEMLVDRFGIERVKSSIMAVNSAIELEDWIFLADIIDAECIPAIEAVLFDSEQIRTEHYSIENTPSGYKTIKSLASGTYLHSATDPLWEAQQLADDIYDPAYRGYIVWGCGLGYFACKLGELTDGSVPITVFEEDEELIELGRKYGCIDQAIEHNVKFICDPMVRLFTKEMSEHPDYGLMVHRASIGKIANAEIKNALLRYYEHIYEPSRLFSVKYKRNYFSNTSLGLDYIDSIGEGIKGKEVIIAAAGPSLDDSLDFLMNRGDRMIISVGTVLEKLLKANVRPDYGVILDPGPNVYRHVEKILDCGIPLILGLSAYWKVAVNYKGKKYIAVTDGLTGVPDAYSHSDYVFKVGASVITLAIEIAMKMGAAAVYLAGADMAYRNGLYHTDGTRFQREKDDTELIPVEGTQGDTVYTTPTLNEFREWIEGEIARYPDIPVYNLSQTGALIHGARRING